MLQKLLFSLAAGFLIVGCQKTSVSSNDAPVKSKTVSLAIWSNLVTQEMLNDFEKKTGIHVEVSNYSSNEELLAKLQAGASGYDVAVPGDYMVFAMSKLGLLQTLDKSKISNVADLDPKLMSKYFDPQNEFSVPFDFGTTGLAINRKLFKGEVHGWKDVFDNKALAGKYTMLDDVRETVGAALKYEALSLNARSKADLDKAKKILLAHKGGIKGFTSETQAGLINGEMAVAHAYSCDALQARKKSGGAIDYVIPAEGCTFWIDALVIPKGAPHPDAAYELINFLVSKEIGIQRTLNLFVGPSNLQAVAALPEELRSNTMLFPPESALAKCEMIQDVGEDLALWDRVWTEAKAGQ